MLVPMILREKWPLLPAALREMEGKPLASFGSLNKENTVHFRPPLARVQYQV